MAKPNTLVETVPAFTGTDRLHPVLSDDLLRLTTVSADWLFDARNPDCYAGGALPAVGAAISSAGMVSLVPGNNAVLGRTTSVTATPTDNAKRPIFNGRALVFDGGTASAALRIQKTGVENRNVSRPGAEGFVPFLSRALYKATTTGARANGPYHAGQPSASQFDGLFQGANGLGYFPGSNESVGALSAMWEGVWTHTAILIRNIDTAAHTAELTAWVNGELALSLSFPSTTMETGPAQQMATIGGGSGTWIGEVERVGRDYMAPLFTGLSQAAQIELATEMVRDEYNALLDAGRLS